MVSLSQNGIGTLVTSSSNPLASVGRSFGTKMSILFLFGLSRCYLHFNSRLLACSVGEEMALILASDGGNLPVRRLPFPSLKQYFVGDAVLLKNAKTDDYSFRRLVAVTGDDMILRDEKDEPFIQRRITVVRAKVQKDFSGTLPIFSTRCVDFK